MLRGKAMLLALLVPAAALAGCADDDAPAKTSPEPIRPGSTSGSGGAPSATPSPVSEFRPRGTSERWHFHDYWHGSPTITLLDLNTTLNATIGPDGLPQLATLVELPHGTIVPPETGFLTFNITWATDAPGSINLTYKPADSNDFFLAGDIANGASYQLNTTESNCDVPHRQASAWRFNFSAAPSTPPTGVPPRDFHVTIGATIGRPLFIDPPHLNWWRDGEIISIVEAGTGEMRTARTPVTNLTLPGGLPAAPDPNAPKLPNPTTLNQSYRIPVDSGKIVPEGAKSVVVMLNWTTQMPNAPKLGLRYMENNYPSEGPLELLTDTPGARVYTLKIMQAQTDTTYSNRTTWEFRVVPEGEPAAAFDGSFTLVAWATRLDAPAAVQAIAAAR